MSEALVKKESEEMLALYGEDIGKGQEDTKASDFLIPRLYLLQEKNKKLKELDDAEVGDYFNSIMETTQKEVIATLACEATREFVEWHPRESRKGVAGRHPEGSPVFEMYKDSFGKIKLENGNELVDTLYVPLGLEDGTFAFLVLSSTGISPFKRFFMRLFLDRKTKGNPPTYAVKIKLSCKEMSKSGNDYVVPVFEYAVGNDFKSSLVPPSDVIYQAGKTMHQLVKSGVAAQRMAEDPEDNDTSGDAEEKSPLA